MKTTLTIPAVVLLIVLPTVSAFAENECEKTNDQKQGEEKQQCDRLKQEAEDRAKADSQRRALNESDKGRSTVQSMAEERARLYDEWEKSNLLPNAPID